MRQLERKYAREVVVIGVHSAKFPNEKGTDAVRQAVLRLSVGHPVVNDRDFRVWREYTIRAWPTITFIDPLGKVIGRHEGEFNLNRLDATLAAMIEEFDAENLLDRRPLSFTAEHEKETDRPLFFPGKVLADTSAERLYVADTGHHRVVECSLDGERRRVFGDGEAGRRDGEAIWARFNGPLGLALHGGHLFLADTENHAIRCVDRATGQIETFAGTGEHGSGRMRGGPAQKTPLNSPWDLAVFREHLYVAMAGAHQVWRIGLEGGGDAMPWAGSGRENIGDGPLTEAMLAQPSGLALDPDRGVLYIADSEVSGIRAIDLLPGPDRQTGWVRTLVGQGLFDFGDVDGQGAAVRLQHPLGVAWADGVLYIADSYNHKIKRLDPRSGRVDPFLGTGTPGHRDGPAREAQFSEPSGLTIARGKLYVADTNNHAVRVCDLATGMVGTLTALDS
ncbi:MAG: alkyl hydroperoxide reductase [Planctomycetes bacterium]|nr:alkyl hydroperoxide reductase [Planctomycetota bacterium]